MGTEAPNGGLVRLSRLTRWIAAGGIAVAGMFTALVARAQPGKTATTQPTQSTTVTTQAPTDPSATAPSATTPPATTGDTSGLQAPAQPPAPSRGSGRAVSGGS